MSLLDFLKEEVNQYILIEGFEEKKAHLLSKTPEEKRNSLEKILDHAHSIGVKDEHIQHIARWHNKSPMTTQDVDNLKPHLNKVLMAKATLKQKGLSSDVGQFKSPEHLKSFTDEHIGERAKTPFELKMERGRTLEYGDDKVQVYQLHKGEDGKAASEHFYHESKGVHPTAWCTARGAFDSYTQTNEDDFSRSGQTLHPIHIKNDENSPYQAAIKDNNITELRDVNDHEVQPHELAKKAPSILKAKSFASTVNFADGSRLDKIIDEATPGTVESISKNVNLTDDHINKLLTHKNQTIKDEATYALANRSSLSKTSQKRILFNAMHDNWNGGDITRNLLKSNTIHPDLHGSIISGELGHLDRNSTRELAKQTSPDHLSALFSHERFGKDAMIGAQENPHLTPEHAKTIVDSHGDNNIKKAAVVENLLDFNENEDTRKYAEDTARELYKSDQGYAEHIRNMPKDLVDDFSKTAEKTTGNAYALADQAHLTPEHISEFTKGSPNLLYHFRNKPAFTKEHFDQWFNNTSDEQKAKYGLNHKLATPEHVNKISHDSVLYSYLDDSRMNTEVKDALIKRNPFKMAYASKNKETKNKALDYILNTPDKDLPLEGSFRQTIRGSINNIEPRHVQPLLDRGASIEDVYSRMLDGPPKNIKLNDTAVDGIMDKHEARVITHFGPTTQVVTPEQYGRLASRLKTDVALDDSVLHNPKYLSHQLGHVANYDEIHDHVLNAAITDRLTRPESLTQHEVAKLGLNHLKITPENKQRLLDSLKGDKDMHEALQTLFNHIKK